MLSPFSSGTSRTRAKKTKSYIIERHDDAILLAEHHKNEAGTIHLANQFGRHNWKVTASPARPTERSALGNTAGVLVGIKNFLDSRPPAFATDAEGKLTSNAQLTGRMLVLSWLELLVLAGYLESRLGFTGSNYEFVAELEFLTRRGNVPFILAIDANEEPEAWNSLQWKDKKYLEHLNADIAKVRNSEIACVGARNQKRRKQHRLLCCANLLPWRDPKGSCGLLRPLRAALWN